PPTLRFHYGQRTCHLCGTDRHPPLGSSRADREDELAAAIVAVGGAVVPGLPAARRCRSVCEPDGIARGPLLRARRRPGLSVWQRPRRGGGMPRDRAPRVE